MPTLNSISDPVPDIADGTPPCATDPSQTYAHHTRARIWRVLPPARKSHDLTHGRPAAANSAEDCLDDVDCFDW